MRSLLIFSALITLLSSCLKTDVLKHDTKHFRESAFYLSGDFEQQMEFEYSIISVDQSISPTGPTCSPNIMFNLKPSYQSLLEKNWDGSVSICVYDNRTNRDDCFSSTNSAQVATTTNRGFVPCNSQMEVTFILRVLAPNGNVLALATQKINLLVNL